MRELTVIHGHACVKPRDRVIAIDGRAISALTADVAWKLISLGSISVGQVVTLDLERTGQSLVARIVATQYE